MGGKPKAFLAWSLMPGRPQIVAVCTSQTVAARYREYAMSLAPGARFHIEPVLMDHAFGRNDLQSAIYAATPSHGSNQP